MAKRSNRNATITRGTLLSAAKPRLTQFRGSPISVDLDSRVGLIGYVAHQGLEHVFEGDHSEQLASFELNQCAIIRTMGVQPIDWKKPFAPQKITTKSRIVLGLVVSGDIRSVTRNTAIFIDTEPTTPRLAINLPPKRSASWPFTNCPTAYISVRTEKIIPI